MTVIARDQPVHVTQFTAQRQATLPRTFVQFPAVLRGVISDLLTRRLCWCRQLAVRRWVTARFRRLQQEPAVAFAALSCQRHAFLARLPPRTQDCTVSAVVPFRLTAFALFRDTDIVRWSCSSTVILPP